MVTVGWDLKQIHGHGLENRIVASTSKNYHVFGLVSEVLDNKTEVSAFICSPHMTLDLQLQLHTQNKLAITN